MWHEAGGTEGTDPKIQEAAAHSKPLTWASVAVQHNVWLSQLHVCFGWHTLGGSSTDSIKTFQWIRCDELTVRTLAHPQQGFQEQMLQDFLSACTDVHLTGHFPLKFLGQLQTQHPEDRCDTEKALEVNAQFISDSSQWMLAEDRSRWSQEHFWWEWQEVFTKQGKPLRVASTHNNLCTHNRPFPQCPRLPHVARTLHFTPQCFSSVANSVSTSFDHPGCEFLGVLYDVGIEGWHLDLPKNGLDVIDSPVYWKLPYGTVKCWSLHALLQKTAIEFQEKHTEQAYQEMASHRGWHCLGKLSQENREAAMSPEFDWRACIFHLPDDERSSCWWVTNPGAAGNEGLKIFNKSLTLLALENQTLRVCTPSKLRAAVKSRQQENLRILEELKSNMHWTAEMKMKASYPVTGHETADEPQIPEGFLSQDNLMQLHAAAVDILEACRTNASTEAMGSSSMDDLLGSRQDDLVRQHAAKLLLQRVSQLRSLGKKELYSDLFQDTPRAAYDVMWDALAESLQHAAEAQMRQLHSLQGLRQELPREADLASTEPSSCGTGPDGFAQPLQRLPKGYVVATKHAETVLLDRLYLALEAHYERVLQEECAKQDSAQQSADAGASQRAPRRASRKAMQYITQRRYEALEVPDEVGTLLRKPQDEKKWPVLLQLGNSLRKLLMEAPSADMQIELVRNLSAFGSALRSRSTNLDTAQELKNLAVEHHAGEVTPGVVCDLLLLDFAMVQWLRMVRSWSEQDVTWTTKEKRQRLAVHLSLR